MIVRYVGPVADHSGYGTAARNNIVAMLKAGIDLTVFPVTFEKTHTNYGDTGTLIGNHTNVRKDFDVNIIHLTPENWSKFIVSGKYNIGYTVWETDKLPISWVKLINQVNEVWVPSEWNKEVFINSGITIPIKVVPHTLDITLPNQTYPEIMSNDSSFKFYSIFQWTERKNPLGLLTAYLSEFNSEDNVTLILKTYQFGFDYDQQVDIKTKVKNLKQQLGLQSYPKINFIGDLLMPKDIYSLHSTGNCLVSIHRGEGSGLTLQEAMLFGKPIIATNWSGNLEFTKPDNSYLVDYELRSVSGMPWDKYTPDQMWADPSINHTKERMRYVYTHQDEAKVVGLKAQSYISSNFSYDVIGNKIKDLLCQIKN